MRVGLRAVGSVVAASLLAVLMACGGVDAEKSLASAKGYLAGGDRAAAIVELKNTLQAKPDLGEAFLNRGAAALGARRFGASLSDLNQAIELGVQEPEKAYYNRALAYEKLGLRQAAFADYAKAIELRPEWQQPRTELARLSLDTP